MTPTKEQVVAMSRRAVELIDRLDDFIFDAVDKPVISYDAIDIIATAIATARLEGEAKGLERGLDEAANEMKIWFDNFMRQSHGAFQSPKDAILALKEKP